MIHTTLCTAAIDRLGQSILGGSADALIFSDRDGVIRLWNAGAERVFGFSSEEALGQSLDLIVPEKQRERHWAGYGRVMQTGQSRYGNGDLLRVPGLRKDGSRISLEFTIAPIHDGEGHIAGLVAILRDVTSRFDEIRELRKEVSRLRDAP